MGKRKNFPISFWFFGNVSVSKMKTKLLLFNNTSLEDMEDIKRSLAASSYEITEICRELEEVKSKILSDSAQMIIAVVNKQFDRLFSCVKSMHQYKPVPVVVFTYVDDKEVIQAAIKAGVSAYIVDGLEANRIVPILDIAMVRFEEQQAVHTELEKTKEILSERKVIEKAKGILMQRSNLAEEEAYKAMRKLAMDKNMKIAELAKSIISANELLA